MPNIQSDAPVLGLVRHTIKDGKRQDFAKAFAENRSNLNSLITGGKAAGGWLLEERERGEFVLFTPWEEVQ
jgi:hypothetical protein